MEKIYKINKLKTKGFMGRLESNNYTVVWFLVTKMLFLFILVNLSCDNDIGPFPEPNKETILRDSGPSWSPDGKYIAYHHQKLVNSDSTYTMGLYIIDTNGQNRTLVFSGNAYNPDWSPDGKKIAFNSSEIYTINKDADSLFQVTSIGGAFFPSWSPDGKKLLFDTPYQDQHGTNAIWMINVDGTMLHDISLHGNGELRDPDWSPDAIRILYYKYIGIGTSELFTMDTSGGNSQRITFNTFEDFSPSWSPDGNKIAWTQNGIWLMKSDGTEQRKIVDGLNPSWSPDGSRIAFERRIEISPNKIKIVIATVNLQTNNIKNITQ